MYLSIDESTLEIRTVEITDNTVGDVPMLAELLKQIEPDEAIASVSADGAYDTWACHATIAARGAMDVIPLQVRNAAVAASKRLGKRMKARSFARQMVALLNRFTS